MKLTSDLDYSLTKKRLLMMGKSSSLPIRNSRRSVLFTLLVLLTLSFCTSENKIMEFTEPEDKVRYLDGSSYDLDPPLMTKVDHYLDETGEIKYRITDSRLYNTDRTLFTGIQKAFLGKTGELGYETEVESGLPITITYYDTARTEGGKYSVVKNEYEGELLATRIFIKEDGTIHGKTTYEYDENGESVSMRGYISEQIIVEFVDQTISESGWNTTRYWHQNGSPKFELTSDSLGYQGLMTLYDEQGDVLQQERYKDGELIEKIK